MGALDAGRAGEKEVGAGVLAQDGILHADPTLPQKGYALLFNPMDTVTEVKECQTEIVVSLQTAVEKKLYI